MDNDNNSVEGVIVRSLNANLFYLMQLHVCAIQSCEYFDAIDGLM